MEKVKKNLKELLDKVINVFKYIFKGLIFVIIGVMIAMPFIVKNTKFKGDDINTFNRNISVMSIEGKVSIKAFDSYAKTGIDYNKYNDYIKNYNKSNIAKKTFTLELFMLFILLETICLYYIFVNIIKLFVNKEENDYRLYMVKKSFIINVVSIFLFSLLRRFFFRNTIFGSLDISLVIYYIFTILMFLIIKKIIEMNKVVPLKEKKSDKYKKNN